VTAISGPRMSRASDRAPGGRGSRRAARATFEVAHFSPLSPANAAEPAFSRRFDALRIRRGEGWVRGNGTLSRAGTDETFGRSRVRQNAGWLMRGPHSGEVRLRLTWHRLRSLSVDTHGITPRSHGITVGTQGITVGTQGIIVGTQGITPRSHGITVGTQGLTPHAHGIPVVAHGITSGTHGITVVTHEITPLTHGITVSTHGISLSTHTIPRLTQGLRLSTDESAPNAHRIRQRSLPRHRKPRSHLRRTGDRVTGQGFQPLRRLRRITSRRSRGWTTRGG